MSILDELGTCYFAKQSCHSKQKFTKFFDHNDCSRMIYNGCNLQVYFAQWVGWKFIICICRFPLTTLYLIIIIVNFCLNGSFVSHKSGNAKKKLLHRSSVPMQLVETIYCDPLHRVLKVYKTVSLASYYCKIKMQLLEIFSYIVVRFCRSSGSTVVYLWFSI